MGGWVGGGWVAWVYITHLGYNRALMRPAVKREWAAAFIGVKIQLHHWMVDANRPASKDDGL
jgi:hypothetical protein